jgi:hypothetical protein
MPINEMTAVSNDPSREAKPTNMDQHLLQAPASARAPAESCEHTGRKPMFRAD